MPRTHPLQHCKVTTDSRERGRIQNIGFGQAKGLGMVGYPTESELQGSVKALNLKPESHQGIWEFPKIGGTLFGGPYNKDPTIYLDYYIRVPYFRKLPYTQAQGLRSKALNPEP